MEQQLSSCSFFFFFSFVVVAVVVVVVVVLSRISQLQYAILRKCSVLGW